jgi:hypothetical protein
LHEVGQSEGSDPMPSHAVAQSIPPEAKQLGSPHHIAPGPHEGLSDARQLVPIGCLHCGLRYAWDRLSRGTWQAELLEGGGVDGVLRMQQYDPLHQVAQLAHIARPDIL